MMIKHLRWLYWRFSVDEGDLVIIKYFEDRFVEVNREAIDRNGKDKKRYDKLFIE